MKIFTLLLVSLIGTSLSFGQKSSGYYKEDTLTQIKDFRSDNYAFLKSSLGMSEDQLHKIQEVNLSYVTNLDRIDKYASNENKMKFAEAATTELSVKLDAIMGPDNRKKYMEYILEKLDE